MAGVALILSAGLEVPTHPEHLHSNPNKLRKNPGDSPQGSTFPSRVARNLNKLKIRNVSQNKLSVIYTNAGGSLSMESLCLEISISGHDSMKKLISKIFISDNEQVAETGKSYYDSTSILTFG